MEPAAVEVRERNRFWGCIYDAPDGSTNDLTVSQIMAMRFKGLPLRIEHHEGDIGRVVDSKTDPITGRTEVCFELTTDYGAITARQQIEKGVIKQLSLKHLVYPGNRLVPVEVSLCIQGARPRTDVYKAKNYKCADDAVVTQPLYTVCCSAASNPNNRIYMEGGGGTTDAAMQKAIQEAVAKRLSEMSAGGQQAPEQALTPGPPVQSPTAALQPVHPGQPTPPPTQYQADPVQTQPRDDGGRFAQEGSKRSYEEMVNETSSALALDTPEKKKLFMDFAVQSAKSKYELELTNRQLMERVDVLGREQQKNMQQAETVVEQVSDALSKIYGNFAPNHTFQSGEFKDEMMKNPVLSRELAPLVVACSNLFQAQSNVTQTKMASEIDNLSKQISFYSQSFDTMGGPAPAAWIPKQPEPQPHAFAPAATPPAYQMQPAPLASVAASARHAPYATPDHTHLGDVRAAVGNLLSSHGGFNAAGGGMEHKMPRDMLPKASTYQRP
jgi:hypothetical protein